MTVTLTPEEVALVCRLVNELAGIQWDASKTYLIESRLRGLLKEHACRDLADLVGKVRTQPGSPVRTAFIDAITTRETLFFRDESPFDALRHKALPEIIDVKAGTSYPTRLRMWSAACSSGQEPYSLAIVLRELIDDIDDWDVQILATDISPAAIAAASRGVYTDFEIARGMPTPLRDRYFQKAPGGWRVSDEVRSLVSFEHCNLLQPFSKLGPFDVIFCRNVAIYFEADVKRDLFSRLAQVLAPHGSLFVGSSENLTAFGDRWKPQFHCRNVFYQPNRPPAPPTVRATQPTLATAPRAALGGVAGMGTPVRAGVASAPAPVRGPAVTTR